jgi:aspartate aminotransferase
MRISRFAAAIEPSATLKAAAMARELKAGGVAVLDFSLGEPDFLTPEHIRAAAKAAMDAGHTHYTPATGIPELKKAIAAYHKSRHGLEYAVNQVAVSSGAKHALYTAMCATLDPGDEVIIPTPYWVSYRDLVQMTGAKAVLVAASEAAGLKITPAQLRSAITPKTRMLLLNSPSNPTGATYTPAELAALAEIVVERDLLAVSDEIYERLLYGDAKFQAFAALGPEVYKRTLTINGVSKSFAMTGWRIGWTAGPPEIIKAMDSVQSQQTSNPSSVSQHAALAALTGDQRCVEEMLAEFAERRDYVVGRLQRMPGVRLAPPTGAFYAFFNVADHFGKSFGDMKVDSSNAFCMALLQQAHVNLVEGGAFGAEGYVRLSFAASMANLRGGLDRLEEWLASAKA